MSQDNKEKAIAAGITAVMTAAGVYFGVKGDKAKTTHRTNEAIRKEKELDQLKEEHKKRLSYQDMDIEEQRHLQRMRHMEEMAELKKKLKGQPPAVSTPQAAIESGDKTEDEKEMLPEWKLLLREGQEEDDEAVSMEDVENSTDPEVLQEIIYQGINLIAANEKVGKTIFCMHLATALAKGERTEILPQQGIAVRQHVCYYDFENGKSVIHKNFSKRIDEVVNKGDLELFAKAFDAGEMLEEIAKKVAKYHYKYKHLTFVVDCIYDMGVDETDELQQGLKRIGSNAMDDYGCQVTILLVQHLNDNDKVKGSKNLKRAASTIITLVPDPSDDNLVQISWKGRCVTKGSTMCIRKGPLEGYYNDLHYEPYEMTPDSTSQPDSASTPSPEMEEPAIAPRPAAEIMGTHFSPRAYGELSDTEKMAIYQIVKMEIGRGTIQKEIARRLCALGPVVSEVNISNIKKDTHGVMREKLRNNANMAEVNKLRELYSSKYQLIRE